MQISVETDPALAAADKARKLADLDGRLKALARAAGS
jgi:hypothetical protein